MIVLDQNLLIILSLHNMLILALDKTFTNVKQTGWVALYDTIDVESVTDKLV